MDVPSMVRLLARYQRAARLQAECSGRGRTIELDPARVDEAAWWFRRASGYHKIRMALLERMGLSPYPEAVRRAADRWTR